MNLTKEKLQKLWKQRESIFTTESELVERFDSINDLFNKILDEKKTVKIENESVKIGDNLLEAKGKYTIKGFAPASDENTDGKGFGGVKKQSECFYDFEELVLNIGCLLGGFDFETKKMIDKYRIISNTITKKDDYNGSLNSSGIARHPSSHFADNNYFFNIMHFLQQCKPESKNKNLWNDANIVIRYPGEYFKVDEDDRGKEFTTQKEILNFRFPPKFLWMWANKEEVIHPFSLMAFRNFLNTTFMENILEENKEELAKIIKNTNEKKLTPENITNMSFDNFCSLWKKITEKIIEKTKKLDGEEIDISELSKLISIIMVEETDIKNISDLLTTGNQAVILWGPPGTGKTYESEQVVRELLDIGEKELEKYKFSKKDEDEDQEKGYYEIIQFHPNYGYEDLIGGIFPDIHSKSVSYILRQGIFKRFCDSAAEDANKNKKYIFIIDEINRAELSAVFGELLYALEYRGQSIELPHFGSFTIPKNVYIIGTMNNVDKSLVTFDLALRRRFGFFKLMPKLEVLLDDLGNKIEDTSLNDLYEKAKKLNESITTELQLGEDYKIGQAYFLKIKDFLPKTETSDNQPETESFDRQEENTLHSITSFELEKLWVYHIEPLLEEYLGMSLEDDEIINKLKTLKEEFLDESNTKG